MGVMIRPLALLAALLAATSAWAQAPALRSSVSVTTDIVRIGDLVDYAGPAGNVAVFRAPDLGTTGSVRTEQILEVVRPHGLTAIDTRGLSEVVVTRRSRAIHPDDLKVALAEVLAPQLASVRAKDLAIVFDQAPQTIHVEESATADVQFARLTFDPRSGRFDAAVEVPGSEAVRRLALRLTGSAAVTVEAVVAARNVARGETLRPGDLVVERRNRRDLGNDSFVSPDSAIGMTPRRPLQAGQLLRAGDLMKPDLVTRNDIVTLVFEAPGLSLTTRAKANSSGAEGDIVSVTNLQSKRIIQGVVTAPGTVSVTSSSAIVSSALGVTDPTITGSTPVKTEVIRPASQPRS
jgi:flagella basal body P-ring formation protein FlgA